MTNTEYLEVYFIDRPQKTEATYARDDDAVLEIWRDADGHPLLWSGGQRLPEIGEKITITMNSIGPAVVKGYFKAGNPKQAYGMYLGVMTLVTKPPKWLRDQRKREMKESPTWAERPQWYRDGIGCEYGTEIEVGSGKKGFTRRRKAAGVVGK